MNQFELLNNVQTMLIDFANENGYDLSKDFKTVDEFKMFVVALTVKSLVDGGVEVKNAFDAALGEGQFDSLAARVCKMAS